MNRWMQSAWKGTVLLLTVLFSFQVQAAGVSQTTVVESIVQQTGVQVFLTNMPETAVTEARISAIPVDFFDLGTIAQGEVAQDILFLVDTSTSMTAADQNEILHTLEAFLSSKPEGTSYALMTFGEGNNLLCDFTEDRYTFQQKMNTFQFQEQGSSFYAAITRALDLTESRKTEGRFVQLVVFTDGVEYDETGLTQSEMFAAIQEKPVPIHTFGCQHLDNVEQLKSLYALSRISGGISMALGSEQQPEQYVQPVWDFQEKVHCLNISIPEELQDGSIKTLGLYVQQQELVLCDLRMPMTEKVLEPQALQEEPPIEEEPLKEEPPQKIEEQQPAVKKKNIIFWIAGIVFIAIIVAVAVILTRKRKKGTAEEPKPSEKETVTIKGDTELLLVPSDSTGGTQLLAQETEGNGLLQLVSCQEPKKRYTVSLDEPAILGRDHRSCSVVFDMDKSISANHCKIYGRHTEVFVEDIGSANHTFVNGRQTDGAMRLYSGDIIRLGRSEFEVCLEDEQGLERKNKCLV